MTVLTIHRYRQVVDEICSLNWSALTREELMAVSWAYYYFSVQFCETLKMACELNPSDRNLAELREGEIDTDNLSPYLGVAEEGEKMNHCEFMRRILLMSSLDQEAREKVESLGLLYLAEIQRTDAVTRVMSLPTYEDGGLERVFNAILLAPDWDEPSLGAFRHFLVGHIRLDSDADAGHGTLCRHLNSDDRILPLWRAFRNILVGAAPILAN